MTRIHQTDPSKPIFIKYAPGATHAPHHPTKEWVDKMRAMKLFDDGYEKLREQIFENQKRLGVIPKDTKLGPWPSQMLKPWDQLTRRREEALHPPGRGLRRLRCLQRPRDRPRDPGLRGPRQARQHADHLHQRRQRHQRRRRPQWHAERGGVLQRRAGAGRRADEVLRRLGHRADLQPHVGRLVVGVRHAVLVVQAERLGARRHQPEHGRVVAGAHQGQGRPARAVRARDRRRADDPRSRRHPGAARWSTASSRRRSKAPASPTPSTRPTPRRRRATRRSTSR